MYISTKYKIYTYYIIIKFHQISLIFFTIRSYMNFWKLLNVYFMLRAQE